MLNKIYDKTKEYLKKEYKFLIILLTTFIIFTIRLPFFIDTPGGIINVSDRIEINNENNLKGSLNLAYVSEIRATIPTYIIAKINKDWDIIKKEEIVMDNETVSDMEIRDKLKLKEAVSNALYTGFKESNKNFEIENTKIYVTYIHKDAKTNIKIDDQIIKIDDKTIETKEDLEFIKSKNIGEIITIYVKNNNKEYKRNATIKEIDGKKVIGIGFTEIFDIKSDYDINIKYNQEESGSSGGFMMALTTYCLLENEDLTNGKKIVGTGTIDKQGNIGDIGGVKYKLIGAMKENADIFLVPKGENYDEAIKIKEEKKYDIKIIGVSTLKEAIEELKKI